LVKMYAIPRAIRAKEKAPCLATGRFETCCFLLYQALDPWHPGEPQLLVVALKFNVLTTFVTPFMCVAAVAAVEL